MNKNDKGFSTQLNDHQREILSRYSGESEDFIFPFLDCDNDYSDPIELRRQISSKNVLTNRNLKKLVEILNEKVEKKELAAPKITEKVSFHVSRHSFAQHAVESGLDLYELMQTLRHSKLETTQKYLKGLDEELADKAMKKVF
jgi:site-specific recombinase XerD